MPPHGVPTNNVLAFRGSATTGPTAPATFPFGGASPLCTVNVGPKLGAGPCVTKFWLIWSCAVAAVGNANAAAMTNPRNGPNMASPYELTIALLQCAKEIWQRVVELDFASPFSSSVALETHAALRFFFGADADCSDVPLWHKADVARCLPTCPLSKQSGYELQNAPNNVRFWLGLAAMPLKTRSARTYRFNSQKHRLSAPGLGEQCPI